MVDREVIRRRAETIDRAAGRAARECRKPQSRLSTAFRRGHADCITARRQKPPPRIRDLGCRFEPQLSPGASMGKDTDDHYARNLEYYEKLVATNPSVERKGATMPYTSLNGHMFSMLAKDGSLALRLPDEERAAFLTKYKTKLSEQYGTVLKEYVVVPDVLLRKTAELKKYFDISYAYVGSLKPKPTTRPKSKTTASKTSSKTTRTKRDGKRPGGRRRSG
jgi:hypothetical protein